MKVAFYTLGCKVNQYETQAIREQFVHRGDLAVEPQDEPDVLILNSCTVTAESDRKTRQMLRHYRLLWPNAVLVLTGCMPQAFPDVADRLLEADIVLGNTAPSQIPAFVERFLQTGERQVSISPHQRKESYNTPLVSDFAERTRAYLKIEDGCERYCSYCIIPTARGPVRSKSLEDIQSEAALLAQKGFCEIVLVGINLSAYGSDNGLTLADAVDAVADIDGISRIRLGSLEPDHMTDAMLSRLKNQPKFCPQFHLSLQSGCSATLKRMNRHYDSAFYRDLIDRIRNIFKDVAITTDVMVGFAGETDQEFAENLAFVKDIGFAKTHVFAYSRRAGTVADRLDRQVTAAVKKERSRQMIAATLASEYAFLDAQIGKEMPVLFETNENGVYSGYTPNYSRVLLADAEPLHGRTVTVRLTGRQDDCLTAERV